MWRVPSQQEPGLTVSFLYIVHTMSVCAARGWRGISPWHVVCFYFFFSFPSTKTFCGAHFVSGKAWSALAVLVDGFQELHDFNRRIPASECST